MRTAGLDAEAGGPVFDGDPGYAVATDPLASGIHSEGGLRISPSSPRDNCWSGGLLSGWVK